MKYRIQYNIGKVKYSVSFWDGEKCHRDGSPRYDIKTFSNKKVMKLFMRELESKGYSLS